MKKIILLAVATSLMATTAVARTQQNLASNKNASKSSEARMTLNQWSQYNHHDRLLIILAAIESLMLAAQAPDIKKEPVNQQCLVKDSPVGIENKLIKIKDHYKNDAFVDVFLVATNCLENGA